MILTSIQIQGFKSFADKTVLKFGKGITAVVGPNGSGKSNISDAVRWVLGEQSSKSLRGQSMEDVIFGGTAERRPHGFCEVTLNIDNSDRTLNFDNDNVSITRRYYRSHESEYQINNVTVRLKDINELFMDTGLGRDGYSMIGQGKIDNIISSKSDERRDIFEEASGISKYRYRKIEAQRKLTAAEDNLLRLKDISAELESRIGPLETASKKAEKFLTLADEKKQLDIGLWMHTLKNSKEELRAQESKIMVAKLHYDEITDMLSEFDEVNEKNTAKFSQLTADIENKRTQISELNEQNVRVEGLVSVLKNDIEHNNEAILRLRAEKTELDNSELSDNDEILAKKNAAAEKHARLEELEEKLNALQTELSGLITDSESISRQIEEKALQLNSINNIISDNKVLMVTADTSISEIESRFSDIDSVIKESQSDIDSLKKERTETEDLLRKIEDDILSHTNAIGGYKLKLETRAAKKEEKKSELDKIRLDIETKERRIQLLTELEKSQEGFSGAVKHILSESSKGVLRGIKGTVASIITVDKKYSVAIETALGNNIQNIIVENDADAKRAVTQLKNNKIGRATFMPIASVKSREFKETGFEDIFGFVGIASELVEVDSKYTEIIKYLLGGTVVTEDIDSAITLAKKYNHRVKVVSLDGQVINPGGTITGGALVKQAGILSRGVDIKRYKDEATALKSKLESYEKQFNEISSEVSVIEANIAAENDAIITANEDKIRTIAEIKHIDETLKLQEDSLNDLLVEKTSGIEKIELLKKQSAGYFAEIEKSEAEKQNIQSQIDEMSGGRDSVFDKRDALSEQITDIKLSIVNTQKDEANLLQLAADFEKNISSRKIKSNEIENEISAFEFKIKQQQEEISNFKDETDNNLFTVKELEKGISDLLNERNDTEKQGVELRTKERDKTLEREKVSAELARLTERKETMEKEYDSCITRLYDEYQLTKSEAEKIAQPIENPGAAKKRLGEIKASIRALGTVNVSAIEEYKEVKERYDFLSEQLADIERSRTELNKLINQLTSQMQELFVIGFAKINENFQKTFTDMFGGGSASLKLENPDDILESGIDIVANLPGKNVPSLDGLSGGEKALVALAIYFAIMQVNPPPFCFLDEVDTALDDINVDRFGDYMRSSKFDTQFICVTHRRGTMEAADMLYGVTMQEKGVTKLLELNVQELEKKLKLEEKGA